MTGGALPNDVLPNGALPDGARSAPEHRPGRPRARMRALVTFRTPIAALLTAALASGAADAQTSVTIEADRDATLYFSVTGDLANGAGTALFAGMTGQPAARRALLHFDLAANVPAGARIVAATLDLHVLASSSGQPGTIDAHPVLQDWTEGASVASGGQGGGAQALAGDATWLHSSYPSQLWTNPGGDFAPTSSFSAVAPASGAMAVPALPGLLADVRAWHAQPAANFGWLLIGDETGASTASKFASREATDVSQRPALTVTYLMPGETGTWGTGTTIGGSTLALSISGTANGGATLPLGYAGAPVRSIGSTFYALALQPVGVAIAPDRVVLLGGAGPLIPGAVFTTNAAGSASSGFVVPIHSPGFLIVAQGAVLDGSPLGFATSNAALAFTQ